MPSVPKRNGFPHSHHPHRRAIIHSIPFTSSDANTLSNSERDLTLSAQNTAVELNHAFVLGTGLFVVLILGYLSRRQIRSTLSRLAHTLSHGHTAQFIQTRLHTVHYSRLHDLDTITSPVDSEGGSVDLESAAHANQDPAPPYSPQSAQVSNMRERRSKRSLHITVPLVQTTPSQASGSCIEQDITSTALVEAEASATMPVSSRSAPDPSTAQQGESRVRSLSNASVSLASPIASRFDAYFRPYRYAPIQSHQEGGNNACLSNVSNRSDSLMSTESPCATPPPQYTITIHSSHRLTRCDSTGRPASVPDIILSPVPWLPRERVPKSPPHYLSIPSRKSRSRGQQTGDAKGKADLGKALPIIQDQKKVEKRQKKPKSTEVKVRHVFSSPVALSTSELAPKSVPTPLAPKVSKPKQPLPRSATYPIQKRALPPLPPPRPVIPMDLEPVYPVESIPATAESPTSSEPSDSWLWPTWQAPADRRLARTENEARRSSYGAEKVAYVEKGDWKGNMDNGSESDDVPLAQELLLAMKRKTMAIEMNVGRVRQSPALDVPRALRKGLFGGLSALAAKARMVIERELDSDEENEDDIEEEERREKTEVVRHRNFVARELDGAGAFVIGEED